MSTVVHEGLWFSFLTNWWKCIICQLLKPSTPHYIYSFYLFVISIAVEVRTGKEEGERSDRMASVSKHLARIVIVRHPLNCNGAKGKIKKKIV